MPYLKKKSSTCAINKTLTDDCLINKTLADTCTINKTLVDDCLIGVDQFEDFWTKDDKTYVLTDNGTRVEVVD